MKGLLTFILYVYTYIHMHGRREIEMSVLWQPKPEIILYVFIVKIYSSELLTEIDNAYIERCRSFTQDHNQDLTIG